MRADGHHRVFVVEAAEAFDVKASRVVELIRAASRALERGQEVTV